MGCRHNLSRVVKWSGIQMVWYSNGGLKTGMKKACMVQNVRYSNGPPSHVTVLFEYRVPMMSGIQVSGIQMVTVYCVCFEGVNKLKYVFTFDFKN